MKLQQIQLKRPVKLLQVFSLIYQYHKDQKSFTDRKALLQWKPVPAVHGYVRAGELFLPHTILNHPDLQRCNLIVIVNDVPLDNSYLKDFPFNDCLVLTAPRKFALFDIQQSEELELSLRPDYFYTGTPERKEHKLCELIKNRPVEIKINGKTDFSLGSRRSRLFFDQQFIFEYIEDFDRFFVLKPPFPPVETPIPAERKIVNMLKRLW